MNWHYSPPEAPHMDGLWEEGVKFNEPLKKGVPDPNFIFVELATLRTRIESCLNSCP